MDENQRTRMMEKLLTVSQHSVFNGWEDFRNRLLQFCIEFAEDRTQRERLEKHLQSMIVTYADKSFSSHYNNEQVMNLLLQLTERFGESEDAEELKLKQLDSWRARDMYIRLIETKNDIHEMMEVLRQNHSEVE